MVARPVASVALACLATAALVAGQRDSVHTFDADRPGRPPEGFTLAAMRQPAPGVWTVTRDGASGRLEHPADPASRGYSLAIAPGTALRDVLATVRVRLLSGARAAGVVWGYEDANNFLAVVLDLGRADLALYRVRGGNRVRLESKGDLELDPDAWHTLKVVQSGGSVWASLGGIRVFEERFERGRDAAGGRAGLIATGDSHVWFDDLRVEEPRERRSEGPR